MGPDACVLVCTFQSTVIITVFYAAAFEDPDGLGPSDDLFLLPDGGATIFDSITTV